MAKEMQAPEVETPELDNALTGTNWEEVTAKLDVTLQKLLSEGLYPAGQLGQEIANAMRVFQVSFYVSDELQEEHRAVTKSMGSLGEIGLQLTQELRAMLEGFGVPEYQLERVWVRRLDINLGPGGTPGCKYKEYKEGKYVESCYRSCDTC